MSQLDTKVASDIAHALWLTELPEAPWDLEDDLCDCEYPRVAMWKNVYLATQHEFRLCCIWSKLYEVMPDVVRTIPGYWNRDTKTWLTEPWDWDGETDMPLFLWHRQVARREGISLPEARKLCTSGILERPRGMKREAPEVEEVIDPIEALLEVVYELQTRLDVLEGK